MQNDHAIQAVICDWGGTLTDFGSCAPLITFIEIFAEQGIDVTPEEAREPMGMAKREHIQTMVLMPRIAQAWRDRHGRDCTEADIDQMYHRFVPAQIEAVRVKRDLIPGAAETIAALRKQGISVGTTTGYNRQLVEMCVEAARAGGLEVDAVVCADDVHTGRPAPWMIFEAMKRLNVYPATAVVKVDDTRTGLEAARHAGCWAVGVSLTGNANGLDREAFEALDESAVSVRREHASRSLYQAGAHFVVDSVQDLPGVLDQIRDLIREGVTPLSETRTSV